MWAPIPPVLRHPTGNRQGLGGIALMRILAHGVNAPITIPDRQGDKAG